MVGRILTAVTPTCATNFPRHDHMSAAHERTKAVVETHRLLQALASGDDRVNHRDARELAKQLLRHYPLDVDLEISAAALPGICASQKR
ncbi:BPSL0761 family protein [Paraburkholderia dilworthii]|uniref:BPSL0761 family protein n=1 Tax=Paraburkholderia dilworthii TaxID=948106 RepID=UPI0038BD0C08